MKRVFLHCGLHKTGSTALQSVFMNNAERLLAHGVLYPQAGRTNHLGGGHRNTAWELWDGPDFDEKFGTVETLIQEVGAFEGDVVISSEDFETALGERGILGKLVDRLVALDCEVQIVVYLRNQMSYCESIYFQHVRQLEAAEYVSYTTQALQNGFITKQKARFIFDYRNLVDIASATGAKLVLRNFHSLIEKSVIFDFLELTGIAKETFAESLFSRLNDRPKLRALFTQCYRNSVGRIITDIERQCIALLFIVIGERPIGSSAETKHAFKDRFAVDNIAICQEHRLSLTGLDFDIYANPPKARNVLTYERLFSNAAIEMMHDMSDEFIPGNGSHNYKLASIRLNDLVT